MNKSNQSLLCFALLSLLWLSSCGKDDTQPQPADKAEGVYITNEGLFNQGNASVAFYDFETETLETGLFQAANGRPLGDILQSMAVSGGLAYLVLNNSQRIEIANMDTFESAGALEGLGSPRYLLPINDQEAYVSGLYDGLVNVVSLSERKVVKTIALAEDWSEVMVKIGAEVFVACPSSWGAPPSNKVYIIDTQTHSLIDSIATGLNPNAMLADKNGMLWVLCAGDFNSNTPGGLYQYNPASHVAVKSLPFSDTNVGYAPRLAANAAGDTLYYLAAGLFVLDIDDTELPAQPLVSGDGRAFYGLGIEPATGNIWLGDAVDFQSRGKVLRYSAQGALLKEFEAGFLPNGFIFR